RREAAIGHAVWRAVAIQPVQRSTRPIMCLADRPGPIAPRAVTATIVEVEAWLLRRKIPEFFDGSSGQVDKSEACPAAGHKAAGAAKSEAVDPLWHEQPL